MCRIRDSEFRKLVMFMAVAEPPVVRSYPLFCPVFTGQNRPYVWGTGVGPKPPREKLTGENPRKRKI